MKPSRKRSVEAPGPRTAWGDLRGTIARLNAEAAEATLPAKAEQTIRQWFSRQSPASESGDGLTVAAYAMALALELDSFTPSHSGSTGVDRLARRRKLDPGEEAALRALSEARFSVIRIDRPLAGTDLFSAFDLAAEREFVLFDDALPPEALGVPLAARIVALDERTRATAGLVVPLDAAGLAVALDFARPGRGIPHGHRCAAAIYRHVVRHGGPQIEGITGGSGEGEGTNEHEQTPLDLLAGRWYEHGAIGEPPGGVLDEARRLVSPDAIVESLHKAVHSAGAGEPTVAAIFRRFAEVMIEALHLRALAGSGLDRQPLDRLAAAIDREIATIGFPRAAAELFRDIRRALAAEKPRQAGDDLTRVIERIRALRAKTVDQGCTEEEALSAADKVAELLDRYGLSVGETDLRRQACLGVGIDSSRKRFGPLDDCVPAVARFCGCRAWNERAPDGTIRSMFFGLPADVEAAQYLFERVATALDGETAAFRKGELYAGLAGGGRQKATTSFQLGLGRGISAKLDARKVERDTKTFALTGRDLVPVKASVVEDELARLGMSFETQAINRGGMVLRGAYEAGQVASGRFEIQSELEATAMEMTGSRER